MNVDNEYSFSVEFSDNFPDIVPLDAIGVDDEILYDQAIKDDVHFLLSTTPMISLPIINRFCMSIWSARCWMKAV